MEDQHGIMRELLIATFNKVERIYSYAKMYVIISNSIAVDNNWNLHLVYVTKTSTGDTEIMYRKIINCIKVAHYHL